MPECVVVVARWRTTDESLAAVLALLDEVEPRSRAEPGCVGYEVFQGVADPTALVLIERYVDQAALEAHLSSAHYQELVADRIRPLLTDRQVEVTKPRDRGPS